MTPARPTTVAARRPWLRRLCVLITPAVVNPARLLAALVSVVFLVLPLYQWRHHTVFQVYSDFGVYRRTAQTLARGSNIYANSAHGLPFTYPPFAAIFVLPLAVPIGLIARILITTVSIAAGLFATSRSLRLAWPARIHPALSVPLPLALMLTEPMRVTTWLGQINAILMAVVVADVIGAWPRLPRGVLTGIATGVKLTPGVFILFLLSVRRRRAALVALATFAATVVLGFIVTPHGAFAYWTKLLWNTDRVGDIGRYGNQSLLAILTRGFGSGTFTHLLWLVASLSALALGLRVAARAHRDGNPVLALGVVGVVGTLVSPISWTHHWVWCIPVFAGLLARVTSHGWSAMAGALAWLAVFDVGPNTRLAHHVFAWTPSRVLVGNDYILAGVALLIGLAVSQSRTDRDPSAPLSSQSLDRIPTP